MNRVGIVIDMSHSAEKSTLDAIEISEKPIAITHANPSFWHAAKRNKSSELLKTLSDSGGILGLSLYPHHLKDNSNCTLDSYQVCNSSYLLNDEDKETIPEFHHCHSKFSKVQKIYFSLQHAKMMDLHE